MRTSAVALAALAWIGPLVFILVPLLLFLAQSFLRVEGTEVVYQPTLQNYVRFFTDPAFLPTFASSAVLAVEVAAMGVLVAFPIAYFLAGLDGRAKYAMAFAFVIPLLMSYIIKIYAIRSLIGGNGFVNRILLSLGVIDTPITLFTLNRNAVLLTLTLLLVPYAILPIFVALERIPRNLLEASADLGASSWQTFRTVVLPLTLQGVVIGASFTFVLALGDFVTPQMVGGTQGFTFGRIIYSQFGYGNNWPFGAALSVILLAAVLVAIVVADRIGRSRFAT
jgi:spermidine/putrescine transport system permease protein